MDRDPRYAQLFEALPHGVIYQSADGRVLDANPAAQHLLGRTHPELLAASHLGALWQPLGEDGAPLCEADQPLERARRTGHAVGPMIVGLRDRISGCVRWIEVRAFPQAGSGAAIPAHVYATLEDVTERRSREAVAAARLRILQFATTHATAELLRNVLDELTVLTDSRIGFFHSVLPGEKQLLLQQWSTRTVEELCHAEGFGRHYDLEQAGVWADCVRERRVLIHNDFASLPAKHGMPEGHAAVVRELVVPVFRGEAIVAVLGVGNKPSDYDQRDVAVVSQLADLAWDITARKRAEEERERLASRLLESRKMEAIGRLAGGIAHDFNNMLGVILGYADLMVEEPELPPNLREDLGEVRKAAARCADLTRQLLAFAQKQPIAPETLDLAAVCERAARLFRSELVGSAALELVAPAEPLFVKIDPTQAAELLATLVMRARDALGGTQHIRVVLSTVDLDAAKALELGMAAGPSVLLEVAHTGAKVDPDTVEHLFEPFFQTKDGRGTGLGIPMVYGIVQQNHAAIRVESSPLAGTTFLLWFPRAQPAEPAVARAAVGPARPETILVVEDEPQILHIVKTVLGKRGYRVLAASMALEALELARRTGPIDLLLTDVVMPGLNGKELHARLEAERPGTPVLFMSGYTADIIENRGVLPRGVHFLQKPFLPEELTQRVREALDTALPKRAHKP